MLDFQLGAVKLKDAFFIGDIYAAKDAQFIVVNKITHVINCAITDVPNYFINQQVNYISLEWCDSETQEFRYLDSQIEQICVFAKKALELGQSVLIHSLRGQSRAVLASACYFIRQFRWTAETSLAFINTRKKMNQFKPYLFSRLQKYQSFIKSTITLKTIIWQRQNIKNQNFNEQEIILINTFLNTQIQNQNKTNKLNQNSKKLQWNDKVGMARGRGKLITSMIPSYQQLSFHKDPLNSNIKYKSIIKKQCQVLRQNLIICNQKKGSSKKINMEFQIKKYNQEDQFKQFQGQIDMKITGIRSRNAIQPLSIITKYKKKQNLFNLYGITSPGRKPTSQSKDKNISQWGKNVKNSQNQKLNRFLSSKLGVYNYRSEKNLKGVYCKQLSGVKLMRPNSSMTNIGVKNLIQGLYGKYE